MNADEYEARLRDAVLIEVIGCVKAHVDLHIRNPRLPNVLPARADQMVVDALDTYADWLRLRAVAEAGCYRLQWSGNTCIEAGKWVMSSACPSCAAEQKIAESGTG